MYFWLGTKNQNKLNENNAKVHGKVNGNLTNNNNKT